MLTKNRIAAVMLAVLGLVLLIQLPIAIAARANDYDFFDPLIDIRHLLVERYVEAPDEEELQDAMITAMLRSLEDPHTIYIPPQHVDDFNKDLRGTYVGIGAEVTVEGDYLKIISPMDGSPALEAGVMAGDLVLEIDGESTFGRGIQVCIDTLLGEPGTEVSIKVRHLDNTEEVLSVTRQRIVTYTIRGLRRLGEEWTYCLDEDHGLMYVRVTQFNQTTVDRLRGVLEELGEQGMTGLLLDLRDNPGGDLGAAVQMCDLFLDQGTIVSVRDRDDAGLTAEAEAPGTLPEVPMIVLVNEFSASASEIVAGALQENGRAKVLGTRTHGKGSVQEVRALPFNRGTLKLTTAYYYLPSGRNLHRRAGSTVWGVDPDPGMLVAVSDQDYATKVRARREFEIIRAAEAGAPECAWTDWIRDNLKDEQLATALDLLQVRVDNKAWPEPDNTETVDGGRIALQRELKRAVNSLHQLQARVSEMRALADEAGRDPLLPEGADLLDGTITLRDSAGNLVREYQINGGDVELALEGLEVTVMGSDQGALYESSTP